MLFLIFSFIAGDKNFNVGPPNSANSFHRSSSTPAFPSVPNGPHMNNGPPMKNGPLMNNGPLGAKGLRGAGFKSNTLGTTTVPDNYVSNMAQLTISTNKVFIKWLCSAKNVSHLQKITRVQRKGIFPFVPQSSK